MCFHANSFSSRRVRKRTKEQCEWTNRKVATKVSPEVTTDLDLFLCHIFACVYPQQCYNQLLALVLTLLLLII